MANFEGHTGRINSLSFSENGYYMASAATDGVRIWDLRKLKTIRWVGVLGVREEAGLKEGRGVAGILAATLPVRASLTRHITPTRSPGL